MKKRVHGKVNTSAGKICRTNTSYVDIDQHLFPASALARDFSLPRGGWTRHRAETRRGKKQTFRSSRNAFQPRASENLSLEKQLCADFRNNIYNFTFFPQIEKILETSSLSKRLKSLQLEFVLQTRR